MRQRGGLVFGALAIWLLLAVVAGLRWFPGASAFQVAGTVWGLTGVLLILWWRVDLVRRAIDGFSLEALLAIHLCRFVGIYFLFLGIKGQLPRAFAFPAGIGDIVVALGAVAALASAGSRRSRAFLLGWNILGLADILAVVAGALRSGLHDWSSMAPLRALPLSLLPTFIVPLILASHFWMLVRLGQPRVGSNPTGNA